MKKLILSLTLVIATPAFAWGDREQGAVAGILGTIILQNSGVLSKPQPQQAPVIVQQPVYINSYPVYNLPRAPYHGATPLYEKRSQWDPNCNCYVVVYNQIGWQ